MSTSGGSTGGTTQIPGVWTFDPATLASGGVSVGSANRGLFMRVKGSGTFSNIGVQVRVASGNISVAAYSGTGSGYTATPSARLSTSGAVACPAAGRATIALGASVTADATCWLALSADNATATFAPTTLTDNESNAAGLCAYQAAAHPLPANPAVTQTDGTVGFGHVLRGV